MMNQHRMNGSVLSEKGGEVAVIDLEELAERMVRTVRNGGTNDEIKQEFMCSAKLLIENALTLLREQEPIKPYMDYDGQGVWRCGKCGNSLMHPSYYESDEDAKNYIRYCSHCGRKVKWDGTDRKALV